MTDIINMFNSLDLSGKIMIGVLFGLVILLSIICIILACKDGSSKEEIDLDFFDELKKEDDNSKSIFVETKEEVKTETPIQEIKEDNKVDIKAISEQMEKDIEKNNIELTEFEVEQEEKAIISYAELIEKVKSDDLTTVNVQTVDLDDRGYNLEDEFSFDTEVLDFSDLSKTEELVLPVENMQSPASEMLKQTEIKSILDIDEVDDRIYDSSEFLSALKELRDSLQWHLVHIL